MEGRKKSGTLRRSFYSAKKRLAAWVLAAAMICTNVGTDLSVAYAAESSETVTFEMYGSDLVTAIEDAIASDHAVSPGDLDFTNGDIGEFENLFFGEGKVLEAYPAVENESIDAEVRVFVRLPEDADNAYMVTGEEELIFLYVNNGEDTISCRTTIYDDEGEKLKTTKAVKVRSFEDAFGEEEVNYISKPVETVPSETQPEAGPGAPEESESAAPTESETGTPEESESAAPTEPETSAPEESESAEPTEPETSAPEESESAAPTEPETSAPEESESAEPTEPEAAPSAEESAEESKEETEAQTEAEEKPQTMEEAEPQESVTAQISRHNAPMVAETEAEKTEETEEKEPESTEESEEESKEKEESTEESSEEETEESTEASSEAGTEESTEASSEAETEESTEASSEAGTEESTEASSEAGTEESTPAETTQAESTAPATPSQPQAPQEKPQTDSVNKADVNDLVGIGNSSTAKAYVTTLNKLDIQLPERTVYTLYVQHILNTDIGSYLDEEEITLTDRNFVDGVYTADLSKLAYDREGVEVVTDTLTITQDQFAENGSALASIDYQVEEGYKAVSASGIALMTVYIGTWDDVVIEPEEDMLVVKVNFLNEEGVPLEHTKGFQVENSGTAESKAYHVAIDLSAAINLTGYTLSLEDDNTEFTLEDTTLKSVQPFTTADSKTVNVICIADTVEYKVEHLLQSLENPEEYEKQATDDTLFGKVGSLTEAVPKQIPGFAAKEVENKEIGTDTVVSIYYDRNEYTLLYDTMGGSYIPSETVPYGTEVELVSEENAPTREGYSFTGWYLDEQCTNPAGKSIAVEEDTRVYAGWKGSEVSFKVVYMAENADDDQYSYKGTVSLTGTAGTRFTADKDTAKPSGFDTEHFEFLSSTTEEIAADGTTVIVVKYLRRQYTITFVGTKGEGHLVQVCKKEAHEHSWRRGCYELTCNKWFLHTHNKNCYDYSHTICGKTAHKHNNNCWKWVEGSDKDLTLTAKYEANISEEWERLVGPGTPFEGWLWKWEEGSSGLGDNSKYTAQQVTMPGFDKKIEAKGTDGTKRDLYYYVEDLEGDITYKGKQFTEYLHVTFNGMSHLTYDEDFFLIDGYDRYESNVSWSNGKASFPRDSQVKFYYTRHEYTLELINGKKHKSYEIPYLADISFYLDAPAENPSGDGQWGGWFLDPSFETPYEGNEKMPKGLVLYAKWIPVSYEVDFVDAGNPETVYESQTVESGKKVATPEIPEKEGHIFKGWFTDQDCTEPFDFAYPIHKGTTIFANWEASTHTTYTVKHQIEDGTEIKTEGPIDGRLNATVMAEALTPAELEKLGYSGYVSDHPKQTLQLTSEISKNVITFTYSQAEELQYVVVYKCEGTEIFRSEVQTSSENYIKVLADTEGVLSRGYKIKNNQSYRWVTLTTAMTEVEFEIEAAKYKITYILDGGEIPGGKTNPLEYIPKDLGPEGIKLLNPEKSGHTFTGWELTNGSVAEGDKHDAMKTVISKGSYGDLTFTATYEQSTSSYTVEYYYDDVRGNAPAGAPTEGTGVIGETVTVNPPAMADVNGKHYVLESENHNITINADATKNVIRVDYALDENENNIPDEKEQRYKIIYKANDGGNGEIAAHDNLLPAATITNLPTREGNTVSFNNQEITAKAGYKFVGMTVTCDPDTDKELLTYEINDAGDVTSIEVANSSIEYTGIKEVIVTVNYEVDPDAKLDYTVEYYKDGVLAETESKEVQEANPEVTLESLKKNVSDETSGYYAYQFESANPAPDSQGSFTITDNATIELYYVKDESKTKDLYYLVNHWIDGEADPEITIRATEKVWYGAGNFLDRQSKAEEDQGYEGYAKDRVTYAWGDKDVLGERIPSGAKIIVHYLPDTNGDKIPDKYQKKVTFNVVHGQWGAVEEGGAAPIEKWITLVDGSGKWSENGSYTLTEEDVPFAGNYPDSGYKAGKWDHIPVGQEITPDSDNLEYTYSYEKDDTQTREVSYTVNHVHVSENGTEEVFSVQTVSDRVWVEENPARIDIWPITLRNGDGWAYDRNTVSGEEAPLLTNWAGTILEGKARTILENGVITVYYEKDGNGDNIPDKYQKKVTFKVEHGQWNEAEGKGYDPIERWITLVDESGKWDENGSYTLKVTDVPSVGNQPDSGYMAGIWRNHPANEVIGPDTENAEYTYYYLPDENQTKNLSYTVNNYKVDSE